MSSNLHKFGFNADGRAGRDADGDGLYDEKGNSTKYHTMESLGIKKLERPESERNGFTRYIVKVDGEDIKVKTPAALSKLIGSIYSKKPRVFVNAGKGITIDYDNPVSNAKKDGRAGRDADGDGLFDEAKNYRGLKRQGKFLVGKGGFKVRIPSKKNRLARGWKITKTKAPVAAPVKDPTLVKVVPKAGVQFFDKGRMKTEGKKSYSHRAPKPGEAFEFKKVKGKLKRRDGLRFTGVGEKEIGKGKKKKLIKVKGAIAMGGVLRGVDDYDEQKLLKAIKHVKKYGGPLPKFNQMKQKKIELLINSKAFLERDRPWLNSLDTAKLNILVVSNFKVDDEAPARNPKGCFSKDGCTGHQCRKMRKMGIPAKEVTGNASIEAVFGLNKDGRAGRDGDGDGLFDEGKKKAEAAKASDQKKEVVRKRAQKGRWEGALFGLKS